MNIEKILLIILFIVISYYPLCEIIGFIRYIRDKKHNKHEEEEGL